MAGIKRILTGNFAPRELRRYLMVKETVFWGLLLLAWALYPQENQYSIMTHTLSFLGSYENHHNPQWWWIFSIAMVFLGTTVAPLVLCAQKRLALISNCGARAGVALMLVGCFGVLLIGVFPEGQAKVIVDFRTTHGHMLACLLMEFGFGVAIILHGIMLLYDAISKQKSQIRHQRMVAPYASLFLVFVPFALILCSGRFVFPDLGPGTPSLALYSRWSFPLWEHLMIFSLIVFLSWSTLALSPKEMSRSDGPAPCAGRHDAEAGSVEL